MFILFQVNTEFKCIGTILPWSLFVSCVITFLVFDCTAVRDRLARRAASVVQSKTQLRAEAELAAAADIVERSDERIRFSSIRRRRRRPKAPLRGRAGGNKHNVRYPKIAKKF